MSIFMVLRLSLVAVLSLLLGCSLDLPKRERPSVRDGPGLHVDLDADRGKNDIPQVDQGKDLSTDNPVPDLKQPDKLAFKDGPVQDQGLGPGVVLARGSFSTGGSGSGGNMLLVESGFEVGEKLCATAKNICIVGGITP